MTAAFNTDVGNNDEYVASFRPEAAGRFDYVYRYSVTGGATWVYAGLGGITAPLARGTLTVVASADTSAPSVPAALSVADAAPYAVELTWSASGDDTGVFGYEVGRRAAGSATAYAVVGSSSTTSFTDTTVVENAAYDYVVRAVDTSFNRSTWSAPVTVTAALRTVTVTFTVTVPPSTDATGRAVHIAGSLDRLDGGLPQWDPAGVALTRVDATHWSISLTGTEGTQVEYKYALGSWDYVEKDGACGEIGNRQLTLAYGASGGQPVTDTVLNWRNVSPCGN